jgi:hypothetical protein
MKREGSGSESGSGPVRQRHGSADPDPDPHQNVMDPEHSCTLVRTDCSRLLPPRRGGTCPTTRPQRWTSIWTSWSSGRTGSCSSAHRPSTGGQFRAFHLKINFPFLDFLEFRENGELLLGTSSSTGGQFQAFHL